MPYSARAGLAAAEGLGHRVSHPLQPRRALFLLPDKAARVGGGLPTARDVNFMRPRMPYTSISFVTQYTSVLSVSKVVYTSVLPVYTQQTEGIQLVIQLILYDIIW